MAFRRRARVNKRRARKSNRKGRSKRTGGARGITTTKNQMCKVTETIAIQDILPGVQPVSAFTLMEFSRARYLAVGFQHYKAAKCTYTYEPLFNTYADDAPGSDTIPYLYSAMNRTGDSAAPNNLLALQSMGARPVKFNKKHVISYKPNWNTPGLTVNLTSLTNSDKTSVRLGSKAEYGWIDASPFQSRNNVAGPPAQNTTGELFSVLPADLPADISAPTYQADAQRSAAYDVVYNGHNVIFDQATRNELRPIGRLTLTVEWHFKTPVWLSNISQNLNGPTEA